MHERGREVLALCVAVGLMSSCGQQGKVAQGRVIAYDAAAGLVTIVEDSNPADPLNPRYDVLPPSVVQIPKDPRQMGPTPASGKLLGTDLAKGELVIFDPRTQRLQTLRYTLVQRQDGVQKGDSRLAARRLPWVDRQAKTITLYSRRNRALIVISVPDEYLALPADTWRSGDEVRYYYKVPGQALRLMNVSQIDAG